jgi:hypothetical protein
MARTGDVPVLPSEWRKTQLSVALSSDGYFGFSLQTQKGQYVAPTTWLPLVARETVQKRWNFAVLNMADKNDFQSKYLSAGQWAEGELPLPLIPGVVGSLLSWIQTRDADNQGKWASVLIDCVNTVKKLTDAKVRKATFSFVKGQPVQVVLDVAALLLEVGSPASPTMPLAAPYIFREAQVQLATGGGGLQADVNCERIDIVVDNVVEDPAEGLRLAYTDMPKQLYNLSGIRCWGAFDRDFVDSAVYGDFLTGTEGALTVTLTRGPATCTLTLPRILYTADNVGLPGQNDARIVEGVQFVALGSLDGQTGPIALT